MHEYFGFGTILHVTYYNDNIHANLRRNSHIKNIKGRYDPHRSIILYELFKMYRITSSSDVHIGDHNSSEFGWFYLSCRVVARCLDLL